MLRESLEHVAPNLQAGPTGYIKPLGLSLFRPAVFPKFRLTFWDYWVILLLQQEDIHIICLRTLIFGRILLGFCFETVHRFKPKNLLPGDTDVPV